MPKHQMSGRVITIIIIIIIIKLLLPFGRQSYGGEILLCMFMLPYQIHSPELIGSLQLCLVVHYCTRGCAQSAIEHFYIT